MRKSISIEESVFEKAASHAKRNGQTFSGLVKISLEKFMEDVQEQIDHDKTE